MSARTSTRWLDETAEQRNQIEQDGHILSLAGFNISTSKSRWQIDAESWIDWKVFQDIEPLLFSGLRAFFIDQIGRNSPTHAMKQFHKLGALNSNEVSRSVTLSVYQNEMLNMSVYRAYVLAATKNIAEQYIDEFRSTYIRFYVWCADIGLDGFDPDVATELDTIKVKAVPTGEAVMRQDPNHGPLREFEYQTLQARLKSLAADDLPLATRVTTWLLLSYGCNPKNLRLLLEEDLLRTDLPDGTVAYELRIPRIKKRTAGERDQFRTRYLAPFVGRLVEALIVQNRQRRMANHIGEDDYARPLLRSETLNEVLVGTPHEQHAFRVHGGWTSEVLRSVVAHLGLMTIEGPALRLTARRLRYTYATKLVASGASHQDVADALDHTDTSHVMVYFNSRSDAVPRLDKAVGMTLAPIAQAFMGKVIRSEADAKRGDDRASRIRHASPTMNSLETVGSCGSFGFCGLHAPLACYTCSNFQPWMDGPHEMVFEELEALRNERLSRGADVRMTQIHDRTMLAVAEVIRRCAEMRGDG